MKLKIFMILMLIATILAISCAICVAEEIETPTEDNAETPTEDNTEIPTVEIPEEVESGLREKLWFLDDAIFNIVMSAVGTALALLLSLYKIVKAIKELKSTTADTIGTKEELQNLLQEVAKEVTQLVEIRNTLIEELAKSNEELAQLKEMCLVAFTTDSSLVIDGRAEEIKKISEEN